MTLGSEPSRYKGRKWVGLMIVDRDNSWKRNYMRWDIY